MKLIKVKNDVFYQYAEEKPKVAAFYRAFGWQIKNKSEHEVGKHKKAVIMRRSKRIAIDPVIIKEEKSFKKNYGKAQKILKRHLFIKQIFAIFFAILGIGVGSIYLLSIPFDALSDVTSYIDLSVKNLFSFFVDSTAVTIALWAKVVILLVGLISFAFIFINISFYNKKIRNIPDRLRKYEFAAQESVKTAEKRVVELKKMDGTLQTKNDRKLFGIEDTANRAIYGKIEKRVDFI